MNGKEPHLILFVFLINIEYYFVVYLNQNPIPNYMLFLTPAVKTFPCSVKTNPKPGVRSNK